MLHDQHHAFLEGQRHGEKLDKDVTAFERQAEALQAIVSRSDGSQQSMLQMRGSASDFLQLSFRISRTIDLTQPWLRGGQAQNGITQMRQVAQGITNVSLKYNRPVIFGVLTPDTQEQAEARAGGKYGNKGEEAAVALLEMIDLQKSL